MTNWWETEKNGWDYWIGHHHPLHIASAYNVEASLYFAISERYALCGDGYMGVAAAVSNKKTKKEIYSGKINDKHDGYAPVPLLQRDRTVDIDSHLVRLGVFFGKINGGFFEPFLDEHEAWRDDINVSLEKLYQKAGVAFVKRDGRLSLKKRSIIAQNQIDILNKMTLTRCTHGQYSLAIKVYSRTYDRQAFSPTLGGYDKDASWSEALHNYHNPPDGNGYSESIRSAYYLDFTRQWAHNTGGHTDMRRYEIFQDYYNVVFEPKLFDVDLCIYIYAPPNEITHNAHFFDYGLVKEGEKKLYKKEYVTKGNQFIFFNEVMPDPPAENPLPQPGGLRQHLEFEVEYIIDGSHSLLFVNPEET